MLLSDVVGVLSVENEVDSSWNKTEIEQELNNNRAISLVAQSGDQIIGWCSGRYIEPEAELLKISVKKSHRRKKIGSLLLSELALRLSQQSVTSVFLEVRAQNSSAISFYQNAGFTVLNRRRKYYQNPDDDALVFTRRLTVINDL